ncbi:MAG: PQQ-binding-like beta-propeller repeat protein [Verrucomicrobiales bacterium]|nr:PQQ-like beta-propeller repeat protein [Verrucomicrobiae bacterium]
MLQISLTSFILVSTIAISAADWPQWRGAKRDGHSDGAAWPESLDENHLRQTWRVELGKSYSGPIVHDGIVFTTESVNDEREAVRAFDLVSGNQKWATDWEGSIRVPFFARKNGSWIRSTPATDGERLFVAGMRDVLLCLDAKTGEEQWRVDFPKELGAEPPAFGFVCSPLLTGDSVIVQAGASTVRLKKSTGEIVWRSLEDGGGMNGSAFSSPLLANIGGSEQLLVQTRTELCGLAPDNGAVLWRQKVPAFRGMNILTPVVADGRVFTSTYGGKSFSYQISKAGDGQWKSSVAWDLKQQGYMSTPVVIGGHAYLHLRNKKFACVDLATGQQRWETKKTFGDYWSLIAQGDRILALSEDGTLRLIRANPEKFEVISERKVADRDTWGHIAVSGSKVMVRELEALTVFDWK